MEHIGTDKLKDEEKSTNSEPEIKGSGNYVTLDAGSVIANRYLVESALGSGNMGSVYKVSDREIAQTQVAIKVLHSKFSSKKNLKRFMKEARIMHQITHKNVVRTYAFGTDGDLVFYTMEYLKGKSLDTLIDEGSLTVDRIPTISIQICKGLEAIHNAQVVHRDLKPANIMVTEEGIAKIMDFGIARSDDSNMTAHGEILGSAGYMSPEIWLGEKHTEAIDIYALGVILYELCTGELPFKAKAAAALMRHHLDTIPTPPQEKNPEVPDWLNDLVMRLLEKDPMQRPRCVRDVINSLEQGRKGNLGQETGVTKLEKSGSSGLYWVLGGTIAAAIGGLLLFKGLFSDSEVENLTTLEQTTVVTSSGDKSEQEVAENKKQVAKTSPKAKKKASSSKPVKEEIVKAKPVPVKKQINQLSSADAGVGNQAEWGLLSLPDQAETQLVNAYSSLSSQGKLRAMKILGEFDSSDAVGPLELSLNSSNEKESLAARTTLELMTVSQAKQAIQRFDEKQRLAKAAEARAAEEQRIATEKAAEEARLAAAEAKKQAERAASEKEKAEALRLAEEARLEAEAKEQAARKAEELRQAEQQRELAKQEEAKQRKVEAEKLAREVEARKAEQAKAKSAVKKADAAKVSNETEKLTRTDRRRLAKESIKGGNKFFWAKDYDGAAAKYREALTLSPNNTEAMTALSRVLQAQGKKAEATDVVKRAIKVTTSSNERLKLLKLLDRINRGSN